MLPSANRLKKQADFSRVLHTGRKSQTGSLLFFSLPSGETSRLGVIVSKKISKKAVVRNKIRRVIQAIFRELLTSYQDLHLDTVVMVLRPVGENPYSALYPEVNQWLAKSSRLS